MESGANRRRPLRLSPSRSAHSRIVGYSRARLDQPGYSGGAARLPAGPARPAPLAIPAGRHPATAGFVPLAGVIRRNQTDLVTLLIGGSLLQKNPIGSLAWLDYQLSIFNLPIATFRMLTRIIRTHAETS